MTPETQNRRLELTGPAKPSATRGLWCPGPGLARQESAGQVFRRFWNRTDLFLRSKPALLAGYPDPLLTLFKRSLVDLQDEGWAVLCSLTNKTHKLNQEIAGTRVCISHLPGYTSFHCSSRIIHTDCILISISRDLHKTTPLVPQHTRYPNNFVLSPWASFRYMQLYHNSNISDVDSFSTHSDGTKGHQQRTGEG